MACGAIRVTIEACSGDGVNAGSFSPESGASSRTIALATRRHLGAHAVLAGAGERMVSSG
jgi:hypothetical protein